MRRLFSKRNIISFIPLFFLLGLQAGLNPVGTSPPHAAIETVPAQNPEEITRQADAVHGALKETLQELSKDPMIGPEGIKKFRALCVGSWCCGKASPISDLDITIDHPDKSVAQKITDMVNDKIAKSFGGEHKIKAAYAGDPNFKEFFTGESGQTFVYEYSLRNSPAGNAAYAPKIVDGKVELEMARADEFWKGVGKPVPRRSRI